MTSHSLVILSVLCLSRTSNAESNDPNPEPAKPAPASTPAPAEDRSNKNGAAAAMGAFGAAVAGMSCMMLMKAAMQEQDPSKKALLQAQAMQQCAQAAQSAASAAQNSNNKKQLTTPDQPAQVALNSKPFTAPKSDSKDVTLPNLQTGSDGNSDDPEPDFKSGSGTTLPGDDTVKGGGTLTSGNVGGYSAPAADLQMIQNPKLGYDEGTKGDGSSGGPTSLALGGGISSRASANGDDAKLLTNGNGALIPKNGSGDGRKSKSTPGEPSESSSEGESKGNDSIESMMASIFGPKEMDGATAGGWNLEIVTLPPSKPGATRRSNIFEYANSRYRNAAYNEGRIHIRPPAARAVASTP